MKEVLPWWVRWLALVSAAAVFGTICYNKGTQEEDEKHIAYVNQQAERSIKIAKAQQVVVEQTQIKYVDRIRTIYVKGESIEKPCRSTSHKRTTIVSLLMLALCACTTPPGQVTIPDLPPILTENPPAFRLLKSLKPEFSMPPAVEPGGKSP